MGSVFIWFLVFVTTLVVASLVSSAVEKIIGSDQHCVIVAVTWASIIGTFYFFYKWLLR